MSIEHLTMSKVLGPWKDPDADTGLIARCRDAWEKRFVELSNLELSTFLDQKFAVDQLIPLGKKRVEAGFDDDTEWYDGHLARSVSEAEYWLQRDREHRQAIASRYDHAK